MVPPKFLVEEVLCPDAWDFFCLSTGTEEDAQNEAEVTEEDVQNGAEGTEEDAQNGAEGTEEDVPKLYRKSGSCY